jgi:hypothetical protein
MGALLALLSSALPARAQADPCDMPDESPDVIVGDLTGRTRYGVVGDITAFAIGTTSCNIGNCWLNWIASTPEHPVIGQNMFRLKSGRFEHIGQSWLKHGFTALQGNVCSSSCESAPDGTHLGVNCSDPYSSGLNGQQNRLGPKFEVNASSGVYPYPPTNGSATGDAIYKRLQVHNADLDPALNAGALYFVEGQYVNHDDATAGNNTNNGSYRRITVSGSAGVFDIALADTTQRQKSGIEAWKATDPSVTETPFVVSGDGLYRLAAKATPLGGDQYHYEYAVQNVTSHRSAQSFSIPIPPGAVVTNIGFHDVDYHSGEPFDGTDWSATVGPVSVTWTTQTFAVNPNANALRWGTLYNFRFDANVAPGTALATIGLFRPGSPSSFTMSTVTPGSCGSAESTCGNGLDDDCDGLSDCLDTDCCTSAACAGGDADGDDVAALCDCNDGNAAVYPGAPQLCDGINNNCSAPGWPAVPANEADVDGDTVRVCGGDCDDGNPQRYPGNPEACDGIDNDCVGGVPVSEADADVDGFRGCAGDCDDANPNRFPGNTEVCDGLDNDCAGGLPASELDGDADGVRGCGGDCDDGNPERYPGHAEACDGLDNDCLGGVPANESDADTDGVRVCGGDCDDADPLAYPGRPETCDGIDNDCVGGVPGTESDADGDGYRPCHGDCDDLNSQVNPGQAEICDGSDNDCVDGVPPEEADLDHDGCRICGGDCDDTDPSRYREAPEICDGLDNDCADGVPADEADADADSFRLCDDDCDDSNPARFPGNPEICDGLDNDCADGVPTGEGEDVDEDGFDGCEGDCDDNNDAIWATPGEATGLMLTHAAGLTTLSWGPPSAPGSASLRYDVLRCLAPSDFVTDAVCVETDGTDTTSLDPDTTPEGSIFAYLVRAKNDCPLGQGSLGTASGNTPRTGRTCP